MAEDAPDSAADFPLPEGSDEVVLPTTEDELRTSVESFKSYRKKLGKELRELRKLIDERDALMARLDAQSKSISAQGASISQLRETAESDLEAIKSLVQETQDAIESASEVQPTLNTLVQRCEEIELKATQAAKRSAHIEDGFNYVQAKRPEVESAVDQVVQIKAQAEQLRKDSQQNAADIKDLMADSVAASEQMQDAVTDAQDAISTFVSRTEETQKQSNELAALIEQANELNSTVKSLLPEATGAGLASSFNLRAKKMSLPIGFWEILALLSLVGLIVYGILTGRTVIEIAETKGWEELFTPILVKSLVAMPLIWLALFCSRRGSISKRVQEDYQYKASIATAFQGFKKQFADIPTDPGSPSFMLSQNVLATLAAQPGRLYDAKHQEVTPLSAAAESIAKLGQNRSGKVKTAAVEAEFSDTSSSKRDAE